MKFTYLPAFLLLVSQVIAEDKKDTLTYEKWTVGFEVPDPVAISFDPGGRAYVTQTQRRKAQDLDIRQNLDWLQQDLMSQSIEDKEGFYRKQFTPENSEANKHRVNDYTGDGIHDIKDLQSLSERIHLIEDSDGDGYADKITLYAEQMDEILTGVAGGVLHHEGEVYACPVPELIKFHDADGDGIADKKTSLVRGFGVNIAYAGHDMHGLIAGPDGRIYWTVGDKGLSVVSKEGLKFHYPKQGALMRCDADGSHFEVYAHGLRNIQEIAFDKYGTFFGVDNDADGKGERERFVHVEQYSDAGWRSNWQYRKEKYNPWMDEQMHIPYFPGQAAWFTPPRSNYENGPAGFVYNPGTALSEAYRDHFFLTSAPSGQQWAFQIEQEDDSYKMVNDRKIGSGIALVGLSYGPDGALYGVDWGETGYPLNEKGGVWRIDVPKEKRDPLREETKELIAADFTQLEGAALEKYLGHPDQRVRLKAQYELAFQGDGFTLFKAAKESDNQLARIHAVWGLGQILSSDWNFGQTALFKLLGTEKDEKVISQILRVATDRLGSRLALHEVPAPEKAMTGLSGQVEPFLDHDSIQVQVQALLALARMGDPQMSDSLLTYLGRDELQLSYSILRHAGVMALAGCTKTTNLLPKDGDTQFLSICKIVALRKRRDPAVGNFVKHSDPLVAAEAARAIMGDWMIPDAIPALAEALGQHSENEAFTRRSLSANLREGTPEAVARVVDYLKSDPEYTVAALETLEQWLKPDDLDPVEGRYHPLKEREPEVLKKGLSGGLNDLLTSTNPVIVSRSMRLATSLELPLEVDVLLAIVDNPKAAVDTKTSALNGLQALKYEKTPDIADTFLHSGQKELQIAALEVIANLTPQKAVTEIEKLVQSKKTKIAVKQFAISLLPGAGGHDYMKKLWSQIGTGKEDPALALDIIEAAKNVPDLSAEVSQYEAGLMAKMVTEPLVPFLYTKTGGDVKKGKQVFDHHVAAQCLRCHKTAKGKGSNVGPILAGIGKKKGMDHLLESLVAPQAQVTKGYGTISLTLQDGSVVTGTFRNETKKEVEIRDPDNKTIHVKVEDIKERSPVISTMPPMGYILNKSEVRDLLAYLMSI
ncbi:MAG: c-type cytochrome [Verrucomicrobiales bacterium]|nr:c-type cytochrome [Verrucomicrobiales bacterium]